jgi:hypothetical protein
MLGHCAWALVVAMFSVRRRRRATRVPAPIPENEKLAGVPLRRLLDDPCGPGAVLRDTLTHHPPGYH